MSYADVVGTVALAVSAINVAWNVRVGRLDRADVKVRFDQGRLVLPNTTIDDLAVLSATNKGRRSIELTHILLYFSDGSLGQLPPPTAYPLPRTLGEGEQYIAAMPFQSLQTIAQAHGSNVRLTRISFQARDGRQFTHKFGTWSDVHTALRGTLLPLPSPQQIQQMIAAMHVPGGAPIIRRPIRTCEYGWFARLYRRLPFWRP